MDGHVEFVSYNGECPRHCDGLLVLKVDGQLYQFRHNSRDAIGQYQPGFWYPGENLADCKRLGIEGRWNFNYKRLPESIQNYSSEIGAAFEKNVPFGCCGCCGKSHCCTGYFRREREL